MVKMVARALIKEYKSSPHNQNDITVFSSEDLERFYFQYQTETSLKRIKEKKVVEIYP